MNNLDLLQILTSYKEKIASMSDEERRKLYLTISGDSNPETQALAACILDEIGKYLLPSKAWFQTFHYAEYIVFECQWEGEQIAVSPAHGYEDRPESKRLYTPSQFMQKFFPGDGRSRGLDHE